MHLPTAVFQPTGIVGGAKWEGKKTAFQDEDEAGASAETTYADELPAAGDPSAAEPSAVAQRSGRALQPFWHVIWHVIALVQLMAQTSRVCAMLIVKTCFITAEGAEPTSPRAVPGKKTFKYGKLVRKLVRQVSFVHCGCTWQVAPNDIAWFTTASCL